LRGGVSPAAPRLFRRQQSPAMTDLVRVPLRTRWAYAAGAIAFGVKNTGLTAFLLIFYNQVVGLPPYLVGLAITISLVIDAVSDPAIGLISDRWRSKWGRRHPFMYASAVPAAVCFLFLWFPPHGWSQTML